MNKKYNKMKKSFVYEYEITPKRKFWNRIENIVNYGLAITFGTIIIGGIMFAIIQLVS